MELDFIFPTKDFLKLAVEVDEAPVVSVLEPVLFYILPKRSNDTSSCFFPYSKNFLKLLTDQESFRSAIDPQTHTHCELSLFSVIALRWEVSLDAETVEVLTYYASVFVPDRGLV